MPLLKAYHRPTTVREALELLARPGINSVVLAGGTGIVPRMNALTDEVVDLQAVGLDEITPTDRGVTVGAMVRLQSLVDDPTLPALLREAARREEPNTFRNAATLGGVVASGSHESELLATLLVFEAMVSVQTLTETKQIPLAEFLQDIPSALGSGLVTAISLVTTGKAASDRVGRTPADKPIVAAVARLSDEGQMRLALCGVANTPVLVDPETVKAGIHPQGDFRGSGEYRRQMAATLARRVIAQIRGTA
jgi:probable selenate reductase FAD-binding subunit